MLRELSQLLRAAVGRRTAIRKQRTSGGAFLTGANNHSGKVLPEIMTIGIFKKIPIRKGL